MLTKKFSLWSKISWRARTNNRNHDQYSIKFFSKNDCCCLYYSLSSNFEQDKIHEYYPNLGSIYSLKEATKITKKKHIGILGTKATIKSRHLDERIKAEVPQDIFVTKIDASQIIEIIERGIFLKNDELTFNTISTTLESLQETNVDVLVLSSTHLSFIRSQLISMFPLIRIVDPTLNAVKEIKQYLKANNILRKSGQGRIRIIVNGDKNQFQSIIKTMGLSGPVETFEK